MVFLLNTTNGANINFKFIFILNYDYCIIIFLGLSNLLIKTRTNILSL